MKIVVVIFNIHDNVHNLAKEKGQNLEWKTEYPGIGYPLKRNPFRPLQHF